MTRRGEITPDDQLILEYLETAGPSTTMEVAEDTIGYRTYARLMRLFRLEKVTRIEPLPGGSVLWAARSGV